MDGGEDEGTEAWTGEAREKRFLTESGQPRSLTTSSSWRHNVSRACSCEMSEFHDVLNIGVVCFTGLKQAWMP